jgi:hypothetical protein
MVRRKRLRDRTVGKEKADTDLLICPRSFPTPGVTVRRAGAENSPVAGPAHVGRGGGGRVTVRQRGYHESS